MSRIHRHTPRRNRTRNRNTINHPMIKHPTLNANSRNINHRTLQKRVTPNVRNNRARTLNTHSQIKIHRNLNKDSRQTMSRIHRHTPRRNRTRNRNTINHPMIKHPTLNANSRNINHRTLQKRVTPNVRNNRARTLNTHSQIKIHRNLNKDSRQTMSRIHRHTPRRNRTRNRNTINHPMIKHPTLNANSRNINHRTLQKRVTPNVRNNRARTLNTHSQIKIHRNLNKDSRQTMSRIHRHTPRRNRTRNRNTINHPMIKHPTLNANSRNINHRTLQKRVTPNVRNNRARTLNTHSQIKIHRNLNKDSRQTMSRIHRHTPRRNRTRNRNTINHPMIKHPTLNANSRNINHRTLQKRVTPNVRNNRARTLNTHSQIKIHRNLNKDSRQTMSRIH